MNSFLSNLVDAYFVKNAYLIGMFAIILIARMILTRLPKRFSYYLWAALGIKAVTDVGFSITISLKKSTAAGGGGSLISKAMVAAENTGIMGKTINLAGTVQTAAAPATTAAKPLFGPYEIIFLIWLTGALAIVTAGVFRYLRTKKAVRVSYPAENGVRYCDYIDSPMAFGIFKPVIYMPKTSDSESLKYILAHERCHIRRGDIYFKLFAFILLSIFWINPFFWVAYRLFTLDMELSCDEAAVEMLGVKAKKGYAHTLLSYSVAERTLWLAQTDFADTGTKRRVKNIMKTKKIKLPAIIAGTLVPVVIVALCFFKPKFAFANDESQSSADTTVSSSETKNDTSASVSDTASLSDDNSENSDNTALSNDVDANTSTAIASTDENPDIATWVWPLDSTLITMGFSDRHPAVDIAAPMRSDVYAALPGTVIKSEWESSDGNVLEIKVNDEITYRYSHLDSSLVEVGSTVKGGEKVAKVGSTGNSTGPHLHYEIFVNGTATDPFSGFYEAPVELEYEDYSADEEFAGIKLSDALLTVRGRMGSGSEIIRYEKGYTTDKKDAWVISVSTISPTPEPHIVVYYVGGDFCIVEE